jgi:hypothetical protein
VSQRYRLFVRTGFSAIALVAMGLLLRADDPSAPKPPPGYRVVYQDNGNGGKTPVFVKDQFDPLRHAGNVGFDPLDHQKVFSETNPQSNKTFMPGDAAGLDKSSGINPQENFATKVYDTTGPGSVYNLGSKSTFRTASYEGAKTAAGYDQSFATKSAPPELDQASSAFAPIGAAERNQAAPVEARTYDTYASPEQNKDFSGPEAEALHRRAKPGTPIDGDLQVIGQIPNRPLSVDEVKNLINHGFKPDLSEPAAPASKPLNDPDYQPEPLRIEPPAADDSTPAPGNHKVQDDDANDPVPSPGTMAEPPPENSEPLPKK